VSGASAGGGCARFAAPSGSDSASGGAAAPFRTAQRLADSLGPGETGCLRAGSYDAGVTFRHGGSPGAPITLRSYPGEKATIHDLVWVSKTAPYTIVEGLYLNGRGIDHPSPTINADDVTFRANDVTNDHTDICFLLGDSDGHYGRADRAHIERNRVHDCGRLPATNHDHGIYVESTRDADIEGNWFYDNADFGVHLYPDAQHTTVRGNVIDGNGMGVTFSGEGGHASSNNTVEGNIVSNSTIRWNIESWWADDIGNANTAKRNCLQASNHDHWYNQHGGIDPNQTGFTATTNTTVTDTGYAGRAAKDFRLRATSLCRATFAGDPDARPGPEAVDAPAPLLAPLPAPSGPPRPAPALSPKQAPVSRRVRGGEGLSARRVSLRVAPYASASRRVARGLPLHLIGRVARSYARRGRRALIQVDTRHGWRTVAVARVRAGGRFSLRRRISAGRGQRVLRLRARVPGVGISDVARVRPAA
jgi:parallel beta-helix repeat protein